MPPKVSSELRGASIQTKIAKLSEFIRSDLEARGATVMVPGNRCYRLIARSPKSPVVQAMMAQASLLATAGVSVQTLFADVEPNALGSTGDAGSFAGEWRLLQDARLLAAHEQLVLSPSKAWIGDCMQREPGKRDSYEHFASDCPQTATIATRSFERLWQSATPVETAAQFPSALASQLPVEVAANSLRPNDRRLNEH